MLRSRLGKLSPFWVLPLLGIAALIAFLRPGESTRFGAAIEGRLLDLRYQLRGPLLPPDSIVIAALDDHTIERINRFPVPRDIIAQALERLSAADANTIAVDLLFLQTGDDGSGSADRDDALARALQDSRRAVLATSASSETPALDAEQEKLLASNAISVVVGNTAVSRPAPFPGVLMPSAAFVRPVTLGHVNATTERDGSLSRMPLAVEVVQNLHLPALSLEAVRRFLELQRDEVILKQGRVILLGSRRLPIDAQNRAIINYYGGRDAFRSISLIDIIDGTAPAEQYAGKLVFVGSTALGFGDMFNTPFDKALPGVAVHATLAANLLDGSLPLRDRETRIVDLILALLAATLAFLAANLRSVSMAFAATVLIFVAVAVLLQAGFAVGGLWLDGVTHALVVSCASLATFAGRIALQRRQSLILLRERENLARYQSPLIAEWLADSATPTFDQRAQQAAVLFVDVVDFTRRSEGLGPQGTVAFLRDLHALFERACLPHGGVITQFIGDGAMIVFGLPEAGMQDAGAGLLAAHALLEEMAVVNDGFAQAGMEPIRLRVSLHYGPVVAAILGSAQQGQVSVSGDTVNVASRMQELAKAHGSPLIVSDEALRAARLFVPKSATAQFMALTAQPVRGRKANLDVWLWRVEEEMAVQGSR